MFYTYLWLREDGTPYYVGKGKGKRGFTSRLHRVKCPNDNSRIVVQNHSSEKEAFVAECFLINFYGRIDLKTGCLANLTEGGEGASGTVVSTETRSKQSSAHKGTTKSEVWRAKIKEANIQHVKSHPRTEQWKAKQSAAHMGKKTSTWPLGKLHVTFDKDKNKWRARTSEWKQLGYFSTREEAENANPTLIKRHSGPILGKKRGPYKKKQDIPAQEN
jgi:hypothetical protein